MSRAPSIPPRNPLSRRLGVYFLGVAIGLVLVGFMLTVRQLMTPPAQAPARETGR